MPRKAKAPKAKAIKFDHEPEAHPGMKPITLKLNKSQGMKLIKGKPVKISKMALKKVDHIVYVKDDKYAQYIQARQMGKPFEFQLDADELMAQGEGLKEFFQKLKEGYTKYVKPIVGPLLERGAKTALELGTSALKGVAPALAPEIESLKQRYGDVAVGELGKLTGLYGGGLFYLPADMRVYSPAPLIQSIQSAPGGFPIGHICQDCKKGGSFRMV